MICHKRSAPTAKRAACDRLESPLEANACHEKNTCFVGADPETRQGKANGAKFTVFSVATQRSGKYGEEEWVSKTEWQRVF